MDQITEASVKHHLANAVASTCTAERCLSNRGQEPEESILAVLRQALIALRICEDKLKETKATPPRPQARPYWGTKLDEVRAKFAETLDVRTRQKIETWDDDESVYRAILAWEKEIADKIQAKTSTNTRVPAPLPKPLTDDRDPG